MRLLDEFVGQRQVKGAFKNGRRLAICLAICILGSAILGAGVGVAILGWYLH